MYLLDNLHNRMEFQRHLVADEPMCCPTACFCNKLTTVLSSGMCLFTSVVQSLMLDPVELLCLKRILLFNSGKGLIF